MSHASEGAEPQAELSSSGGERLEPVVQAKMERAFGRDFSDVRVHHSAHPGRMGAQAFAAGKDLHFAPGRYDPHSTSGQELIGHELAHVVQQSRGGVKATTQQKGIAANVDDSFEREADEVGARVARGEPAGMGGGGGGGGESAPVVQGKNLAQAGLAGGLRQEGTRYVVGGRPDPVKIYVSTVGGVAANRGDGLKAIAKSNALLGTAVDDHARNVWGIQESNDKWTANREALDDNGLNKLDPFFLTVVAKYQGDNGEERLELTHQHAKEWTGYIEALYDTGNQHTQGVPSMYNRYSENPRNIDQSTGRNPMFSNVHDTTDNDTPLINLTSGGGEKNLDAYTKIAGEGARFRCVRKHRRHLRNNSYFYYRSTTKKRRVRAVKFIDLWKSWNGSFGKKYNITNEMIREAIRTGALESKVLRENEMDNRDYELT